MQLFYFLLYFTLSITCIQPSQICAPLRSRIKHHFHALRHCQRSNRTVIGLINAETVRECAEFARRKHGLAFNYGPKDRKQVNLFELVELRKANATGNTAPRPAKGTDTITTDPEEFYNCQVLDCPEYRNLSSIVNDTRFDYYSLYSRPPPQDNATCVPSIGMFVVEDRKMNYSLTFNECQAIGGSLAHVASEPRTNMISKLCDEGFVTENKSATNVSEALYYVGLKGTTGNKFFTSAKEPLECFLYRAWAPGHPSKTSQPGCVAISSNNSWTVHNCNKALPFICELHTSGPPKYKVHLKRKCSVKRPNNRIAPGKKTPLL
ncbi:uncharacterized protein LOC128740785 [Sabethes cyaneus]|uniref:uncharacterized protein LOC128740785 n=1 Tax=Sabethes cyaneus TaxID=53552 RepID=UPI00237E1DC3|nr:uncharacterized protein LOC128740785 [Sabethes cyaneus]